VRKHIGNALRILSKLINKYDLFFFRDNLTGHGSLVGLLSWSPGSSHLVSASADETIRIWDPVLGVCLHTLTGHDTAISCVQSDGQKIISGADGGVKLWDYKTGKYIRDLLTDCLSVWQVKFDERRCVAVVKRRNPELTDVEVFSNDVWRHGDPELTYFEVFSNDVWGNGHDKKSIRMRECCTESPTHILFLVVHLLGLGLWCVWNH